MGFDVSYHPISPEEMREWYFDRLPEVEKGDLSNLEMLGRQQDMDELYVGKYVDTMKVAAQTGENEGFEKTHVYYLAVVQGFFGMYYYTRGTAFSFLIKERPEMGRYVSPWKLMKSSAISCPITGGMEENYSGGVYLGPEQVRGILADYEKKEEVQRVLSDFFEQNLTVFIRALKDAAEHQRGLLEATEVVEPQPIDLSKTASYSNLMNCDKEGALIYQKTAMEQIQAFAKQENLSSEHVIKNAVYQKCTGKKEEKVAKNTFWKNGFVGLFSRKSKEKKITKPEKEIDIQECFRQNLKYISQTEMSAEVIHRQFVKSDTRYHLTVGQVDCPTGQILVSDPLCYLVSGEYGSKLAINIPPGSYPAEVSIYRNPHVGIRMCTARLKVKDTEAKRYICAEPTEETAAGKCSDGILSGFPVEAGMMSFCDAQVAEEYRSFLERWYGENDGKNHYDDYFAGFFADSEKALPTYQREGGDFMEWANPESGNRMVMISSGFGDGFYQSFWGYDKDNEICELIVPLVNPDLFD